MGSDDTSMISETEQNEKKSSEGGKNKKPEGGAVPIDAVAAQPPTEDTVTIPPVTKIKAKGHYFLV